MPGGGVLGICTGPALSNDQGGQCSYSLAGNLSSALMHAACWLSAGDGAKKRRTTVSALKVRD